LYEFYIFTAKRCYTDVSDPISGVAVGVKVPFYGDEARERSEDRAVELDITVGCVTATKSRLIALLYYYLFSMI
jgi:hypothetical protein